MSEGQAPITGLSLIVTLNEQLEEPHEFVAVQVTVVEPAAKVEPDAGEQAIEAAGEPVAEGSVHVATWLSHWVMLPGQAPIIGLSLIVTLNEQLDEPHEFVAVHVTVVAPVAKVDPEAGEQLTVAAGVPVAEGVEKVAT